MGINGFFSESLKAPLKNQRWSWGAIDTDNARVFLRVWLDDIANGRVAIGHENLDDTRPGYKERQTHIQRIRDGSKGFGVVCKAEDPSSVPRRIDDFDSSNLIVFGHLIEISGLTFATITGNVSVQELAETRSSESKLAEDLSAITQLDTTLTVKQRLALARIGQGRFRNRVLDRWGYRCAVTGSKTLCAIRASHIMPWNVCDNAQRVDPDNGLPLIASLDALFDRGVISFEDCGKLLVSDSLLSIEYQFFHLGEASLRREPSTSMKKYLCYHREHVFNKHV